MLPPKHLLWALAINGLPEINYGLFDNEIIIKIIKFVDFEIFNQATLSAMNLHVFTKVVYSRTN